MSSPAVVMNPSATAPARSVGISAVKGGVVFKQPSYAKLFSQIFAQRSAYAVLLANAGLILLMLLLEMLSTLDLFRNLFKGQFIWAVIGNCLMISLFVVIRIKLSTRKSHSLLNRLGLEMLGASCLFSITFVYNHLRLYRPETIQALFYPEGRYGPPLIREQFVGAMVFASLTAIAGFIFTTILSSDYFLFNQERLVVEKQIKSSGEKVLTVAGPTILASLFAYFGTMTLGGSIFLRVFRLIARQFIPIRPTFHSIRACFELGALYQYIWCVAALCVVWEGVGLIISLLFANSFKVTKRVAHRRMQLLLNGLEESGHPLIQAQAIFELHQMLMKDPAERAKLFSEFVGETAASKLIALWLVKKLKSINEEMRGDLKILQAVESALKKVNAEEMAEGDEPSSREAMRVSPQAPTIFVPQKETLLGGLLKKIFRKSASFEALPYQQALKKENVIPEVLTMKGSKQLFDLSLKKHEAKPLEQSKTFWLSSSIVKMTEFLPGQYLAGFLVQFYRSRSLREHDNVTVWVMEAIAQLAAVSYDEDIHGQIQFLLSDLLLAILDTFFLLLDLHNAPFLDDKTSLRIREVTLSEESDQAFHQLLHAASGAIEHIRGVFGSAFDKQPNLLVVPARTRLDAYQKLLANISIEETEEQ